MDQVPDYDAILKKIIDGSCSPQESEQFMALFDTDSGTAIAKALLDDYLVADQVATPVSEAARIKLEGILLGILHTPAPIRIRKTSYRWVAAIAAFLSVATLLWWKRNDLLPEPSIGVSATATHRDGVTLVLDNGMEIDLEREQDALFAENGEISYADGRVAAPTGSTVEHATLHVPVGTQRRLQLPDGSVAWLNAGSTLEFPLAFQDHERRIKLTGEGYFDIKSSPPAAHKPFIVESNGQAVEVLGTQFNIKAYAGDDAIKTTLVEGRVQVRTPQESVQLSPGQQVRVTNGSQLLQPVSVDVAGEIGWKDHLFVFRGATIQHVMDDAARWYGIDVSYAAAIDAKLVATIPRDVPLARFLELLTLTKKARFTVLDNQVTVHKPN